MSYSSIHNAIRKNLEALWTDNAIESRFDNNLKDPPDPDPTERDDEKVGWVRNSIRIPASEQASIGAVKNRWRRFGIVIVQVFVPMNTGDARALQIVDLFVEKFEGKDIDGITFREATPSKVVPSDGPWYQVNTSCSFFVDELK